MNNIKEPTEATKKFIELYRENRAQMEATDPAFVMKIREEAFEAFSKMGFPRKGAEAYKYTHLEPFFQGSLSNHFSPRKLEFDLDEMFKCDIPTLDTNVLLVLNGYFYSTSGEKLFRKENGIIYGSLAEATKKYPELVKNYLGQNADYKNDAFVALNTACARDGIFVYIPENQKLEKPLQIINLLLSDDNEMVQHRNLFIAQKNSQAEIIVCDHTLANMLFLTNSVTEVFVDENAQIDIVRSQNEHNHSVQHTNTWITQERNSTARNTTLTLHGGKVRNNLNIKLKGEGAHCDAMGLALADKQQHTDNFTLIEHQVPNCTSNQHYKNILDDTATGAFTGKIHVFPDAQKTEAYQANNNILLTEHAKMHTRPQLEIYADDVKCSHGATVGQIDEQALFYLRARGIPLNEARMMMMYAFTDDVIKGIKQPALQNRIEDLVSKRLRGELSRCDNCELQCYDE